MALGLWLQSNWFQLLQSTSIVAGLIFAALSIRRDARMRRVSNYLALVREHRELWLEVYREPALHRILDQTADLVAHPVAVAEERLVNLLLVHLNTFWELDRQRSIVMPEGVAADIRAFISLPVPRTVWLQTKRLRDPRFVEFVDDSLGESPAPRGRSASP